MPGLEIRGLYYSVKDVSEITQTLPQVLKEWEDQFPTTRPSKIKAGRKYYRPNDLRAVLIVKRLKEAGFTEDEIKILLKHRNIQKLLESNKKESIRKIVLASEIRSLIKEILHLLK